VTRALVTGGTGFVGANLVRRLLQDGHEVHLLLRPDSQTWRIDEIIGRAHIHRLSDRRGVRGLLSNIAPQWVFHLAAHGAYPSQGDVDAMLETNVRFTIDLVEACVAAGCDAFVFAGSSSEYGFKDHAPAEDELPEPNSVYAVTKLCASMYCDYRARREAANIKVLRLYSVFGPWEEPSRLLPRLIVEGFEGRLPPLANPNTVRDFVYVDDVCEAFLAATTRSQGPRVFNVGSGMQTTLRDAVEVVREILRFGAPAEWGAFPERAWDTSSWVADVRRIREHLGWTPRTAFAAGVERTVNWFRQRPDLLERYRMHRR